MDEAARGSVLAQLAPRQVRYLLRVAEVTIPTGVLNLIAIAILLTLGLYGLTRARIVPAVTRLLDRGAKAAAGDPSAASEAGTIIGRLGTIGRVQIALGVPSSSRW